MRCFPHAAPTSPRRSWCTSREGDEPRPPAIYIPNKNTNLFCAGHSIMPGNDASGHDAGRPRGPQYLGSTDVTIFEYGAKYAWKTLRNAPMNAGRWYGTSTVLANGEIVIISGSISKNQDNVNQLPQVWQTNNGGGWRNLSNAVRKILYYPTQFVGAQRPALRHRPRPADDRAGHVRPGQVVRRTDPHLRRPLLRLHRDVR